jgi:hypothetical protein
MITEGLSLKVTFAYDASIGGARNQEGSFIGYELNRATKELTIGRGSFEDALRAPGTGRYGYIKTNFQVAMNYSRRFGKHTVSAVTVGQRELRGADGAQAPFANEGLVLRTTYKYHERY